MNSGIYRITNIINNKIYIGSSRNIKKRFYHHKGVLKNNKHCNKYLQYSYNKYGKENFIYEILEICNENIIIEREQFYIDLYNPDYNILKTAYSFSGYKKSREVIEKIALKNRGLIRTEELKKRWSIIKKNNPRPDHYKLIVEKAKLLNSKKVIQYDLDMNFIKEHNSLTEASNYINGDSSAISKVCRGKLLKHRNFIFKYKD
jgi:group I intron endonuclease